MTQQVPANSPAPDNDLRQLIDGFFAGTLPSEGLARLDRWLQSNRSARQMYREQAQIHAFLRWRVRGVTEKDVRDRTESSSVTTRQLNAALSFRAARRYLSRPLGMMSAAGLLLAIIAGFTWMWSRGPVVAHLARSVGAKWQGQASLADGTALRAGKQLRLQSGVVEIRFLDGADVILQGPATFRLEGRNQGQLDEGQLAARVPQQARGFSIDTPTTTVVDHGTEFGVIVIPSDASTADSRPSSAAPSSTQVHVFQGEVEVGQPKQGPTDQVAKLTAGKAVEVDQSRTTKPLAAAQPEQFARAVAGAGPLKVDLGVNGNVQEGWIGVDTVNLAPPPLKLASPLAAQGETITIKLAIGGTTKEYASRYRGEIKHPLADLLEDFHMHRGKRPMTVTFSNLAAGKYRLTSYHHDVYRFQTSKHPSGYEPPQRLTASVQGATASDVSGATDFAATNGKQPQTPATGVVLFTADGTHEVTVEYAVVEGGSAPLNGFVLEAEGKQKRK